MESDGINKDHVEDLAFAALQAAILCRDMLSAMPLQMQMAMPPDLMNRLTATWYQGAFDRLPAATQEVVRQRVLADPNIIAARRLDAEHRVT